MRKIFLPLLILISFTSKGINVTIIESQSANSGHTMDQVWLTVATGMGYSATIMPQTTLDNTSFFSSTDILIISSGVIQLPANRMNTILQYVQQGGMTYIQAEYDCSLYTTNATFENIVNTLGGNFSWLGIVSGTLAPMTISGTLSNNLNTVTSISDFWYGCHGSSNSSCGIVTANMTFAGQDFGFLFCPPNPSYGRVICNSDQDWVRVSASLPLMQNILHHLADHTYTNSGGINLNLGNDTSLCHSNSLLLDAGNTGAAYLWSNGATAQTIPVTTIGKYWVKATAGACTATDTVAVTGGATAGIISALRDTLCEGSPGNLLLTGNSGTSVQWQSAVTLSNYTDISGATDITYNTLPLSQTTYYRVVTGSYGCGDTSSPYRLYVPPAIAADYTYSIAGWQVTFNSGISTGNIVRYDWDFGDGGTTHLLNPIHNFATNDSFHVCLTVYDGSNCSYTICRNIDLRVTGAFVYQPRRGCNIYPLPFTDRFFIVPQAGSAFINHIEMYDVLGQKILAKDFDSVSSDPLQLVVPDLPAGVYYIKYRSGKKQEVLPIMKE